MKIFKIIYIVCFFLIISVPLVGLVWYQQHEVTENKELASVPEIKVDGKYNLNYLQDAVDYFSDNFAYRQELVTLNADIKSNIFAESSENLAIVGTDNWLYLKVSLEDYQGTNVLSERGLNNIVRTVSLMQEYVEGMGKTFVYTVSPNKNTLYPEHMPYYYKVYNDVNNLDLLTPKFKEAGINFVDIKEKFEGIDEVLYHKGDSHWNNKGAAIVQDMLLAAAAKEHTSFLEKDYVIIDDFQGDIDKILYPLNRHNEKEYDYLANMSYNYIGDTDDVTASTIETANDNKEGRLLCFRDSFGNSLLPLLAEEYSYGYFVKSIPFRIDYMSSMDMDTCIYEVVERNVGSLTKYSPVMPAPLRDAPLNVTEYESLDNQVYISQFDGYNKIYGILDKSYVSDASSIYIRLTSDSDEFTVEATPAVDTEVFKTASDYGFVAYIGDAALPEGDYRVEIITENNETYSYMSDLIISY